MFWRVPIPALRLAGPDPCAHTAQEMAGFRSPDPESIRRRLDEIEAVEASRRHVLLWSVGGMLASIAISLLLMAWGFSMDDPEIGPMIFFGGALLGNLGILATLLWAYRRGEA